MNRRCIAKILAGPLLLGICIEAEAQGTDMAEALKACSRETDDVQRLACFDEIMSPQTAESAPEPAAAVGAAAASAAAVEQAPPATAPDPAPSAVVTAEPDPSPAAESSASVSPEADNFGLSGDKKALKEMRAKVVEVRKLPYGEHVVTLDNGQVWVEKDATYAFKIEVGDEAVIKKGNFGGYKLMGRGRRSTPVRRVE